MGLFSFLFGKKKDSETEKLQTEGNDVKVEPADTTPEPTEDVELKNVQEVADRINEGKEPSEIKHAPTCKYNDWRNLPEGAIDLDSLPIVGITFCNKDGVSRKKIIDHLNKYEALYLKPEPDNPKDKNAIAVWSEMGQIGYIPKDETYDLHNFIEAGFIPKARFYGPTDRNGDFVCRVYIQMHKPETCEFYKCKVVGTRTEEQKEIVESLTEGEVIDLGIEEDNNFNDYIYVEKDCEKIGKLDKKSQNKLLEIIQEKDVFAMVISNTESELLLGLWLFELNDQGE